MNFVSNFRRGDLVQYEGELGVVKRVNRTYVFVIFEGPLETALDRDSGSQACLPRQLSLVGGVRRHLQERSWEPSPDWPRRVAYPQQMRGLVARPRFKPSWQQQTLVGGAVSAAGRDWIHPRYCDGRLLRRARGNAARLSYLWHHNEARRQRRNEGARR